MCTYLPALRALGEASQGQGQTFLCPFLVPYWVTGSCLNAYLKGTRLQDPVAPGNRGAGIALLNDFELSGKGWEWWDGREGELIRGRVEWQLRATWHWAARLTPPALSLSL